MSRLAFRLAPTLLLLLLFQSSVAAQSQRLFARTATTLFELDTEPARLGSVVRSWALPTNHILRLEPVVAGRYLAWANGGPLTLLDLVTGAISSLPISGWIQGVNAEGTEIILTAADGPSGGYTMYVVDDALTIRGVPIPGGCHYAYAYARDARQLMVLRAPGFCPFGPPSRQQVDIVNVADGSVREQAIEVPYGFAQRIATDPRGTRLWVSTAEDGFAAPAGHAVFDVAGGLLLALNTQVRPQTVADFTRDRTLILDDRSNMLLTVSKDGLVALDGDTLQMIGVADAPKYRLSDRQLLPGYWPAFNYQVLMHPNAAAIFVFEGSGMVYGDFGSGLCLQSALIALDPRTGSRLATRDLTNRTGAPLCVPLAAMAVAPASPPNFTASVVGRRVSLTWDRPPQATHYELEAGSARGLRDLATLTVGSTSYTVDNVPSGTYYVRVRALNYAGKGRYTGDVVVVVP